MVQLMIKIMNNQTFLIIEDLDQLILSYLEPPQILSLSEVNRHYANVTSSLRSTINSVKKSLPLACKADDVRIARWIHTTASISTSHAEYHKSFKVACGKGNMQIVQMLLSKAYNPNKRPIKKMSILEHSFQKSCMKGHLNIAQWLIEKCDDHIDIHHIQDRLFEIVCECGHLHVAQWLLSLGEDKQKKINIHSDSDIAFLNACLSGHLDVAKWLIELGETSYGKITIDKHLFEHVCGNGHLSVAQFLSDLEEKGYDRIDIHANADEALCEALCQKRPDVVKWLIKLGDDAYGKYDLNQSSIFAAACAGGMDIVNLLLSYDTSGTINNHQNRQNAFNDIFGNMGESNPSIDHQMIRWLIEQSEIGGERIDIHNNQELPFRATCDWGDLDMAKLLIELGEGLYGRIDIHACDECAFRYACYGARIDMAQWLIELGEQSYGRINIHVMKENVFTSACNDNRMNVAQWLVCLGEKSHGKINIHAETEECSVLTYACINNNIDMVKWLVELSKESYGPFDNNCILYSTNAALDEDHFDVVFCLWEIFGPSIMNEHNVRKLTSHLIETIDVTCVQSVLSHIIQFKGKN